MYVCVNESSLFYSRWKFNASRKVSKTTFPYGGGKDEARKLQHNERECMNNFSDKRNADDALSPEEFFGGSISKIFAFIYLFSSAFVSPDRSTQFA